MWEWTLNVLVNSGRKVKWDLVKFNEGSPISRDSRFNVATQGVRKGLTVWFIG